PLAGAGCPTGAAVARVGLQVHTGAGAAGRARGTDVPTHAAVVGIGLQVHTDAEAAGKAGGAAGRRVSNRRCSARGEAQAAPALPPGTGRARGTDVPTRAAVLRVRLQVHTTRATNIDPAPT